MSTVYNTEPPPNGKVVLKTTIGDIDMELWAKEAPKAVRNFIQLCLEGYYDGCEFFRVIPDLFAQTGDPTNTGNGGESIYGEPFADEFHSRLRFSRRGIVAMANSSEERNSNTSQFFITLQDCEWLNKKHTIFGRITGDTIFNVLALNELELEGERPEHAPRIIGAEVMHNPFDDIIPRAAVKKVETAKKKKGNKTLAKKNTSLLSFGAEQEEEDQDLNRAMSDGILSGGVKSAHDLLEDEHLSKDAADEVINSRNKGTIQEAERKKAKKEEARQALKAAAAGAASGSTVSDMADENAESSEGLSFDAKMREKMKERQAKAAASKSSAQSEGAAADEQAKIDELKEKMGFNSKKGQKAMRRSQMVSKDSTKRKAAEEFMSPLEVMRQKYTRAKAAKSNSRQQDTMAKLAAFSASFKKSIAVEPAGKPGVAEQEQDSREDWTGIAQLPAGEKGLEGDADLLEDEKDIAGSGFFAAASSGLKFVKTLEEKRAEIHRDDNYVTTDPLNDGSGKDINLRKTQHRRRLDGGKERRDGRDVAEW
jgi:peptidyl-prolyl cis-trans isomerase SDCCAG10